MHPEDPNARYVPREAMALPSTSGLVRSAAQEIARLRERIVELEDRVKLLEQRQR